MAKEQPTVEKKVKCTGCQAYFVEENELCANCQAKKSAPVQEEGVEE